MGSGPIDELLRSGREALAAADWESARSCYERVADEFGESAEVLDGLSQAVHFQGDHARAIEQRGWRGLPPVGVVACIVP